MPTGANNAVIPVRRGTKALLEGLKGEATFDDVLRELLAAVPPEEMRARRQTKQATLRARLRVRPAPTEGPRRSPEKQLMIAMLAERRWQRWLREGRVAKVGPRRYRWNRTPRPAETAGGARVVRRPGRGLAPGEGPRLPR